MHDSIDDKHVQGIIRRYEKEHGHLHDEHADWKRLLHWSIAKVRPNVTDGTWRVYRSKLLSACHFADLHSVLDPRLKGGKKDRKKRVLNPVVLREIQDLLARSTSDYAQLTLDWFVGNTITGLRPKEWIGASIGYCNLELTLRVVNIKKGKSGRVKDCRFISLSALSQDQSMLVRRLLLTLNTIAENGSYEKVYTECRRLLWRVSKPLLADNETISLYTGRHQFSSNSKASRVSAEERAAILGHAFVGRARHSYGGAKDGSAPNCVAPSTLSD